MDKQGNLCPKASPFLFFDVSGAGNLKALCNGNAIDQTPFVSKYMSVFNGKMVAVIEPSRGVGELVLNVSGGLLLSKKIKITVGK